MMRLYRIILLLTTCIGLAIPLPAAKAADPVVLPHVPAYNWYHGCGPTAAASVIGYYDLHGYDNLLEASGWAAVRLTENVKELISSTAHNDKYDPTPDDAGLPDPPDTSIADFFETSVDPLDYGWSNIGKASTVFENYAAHYGYTFEAEVWFPPDQPWYPLTWEELVIEIDAGRPMMFLVNTSVAGVSDHFVPVIGYWEQDTGGRYFGIYPVDSLYTGDPADEEPETVVWKEFKGGDDPWSIQKVVVIRPQSPPTDFPGALSDAVLSLQVQAGMAPPVDYFPDVDRNGRFDLRETIYILQRISEKRP